jgi:hypothetical protein
MSTDAINKMAARQKSRKSTFDKDDVNQYWY